MLQFGQIYQLQHPQYNVQKTFAKSFLENHPKASARVVGTPSEPVKKNGVAHQNVTRQIYLYTNEDSRPGGPAEMPHVEDHAKPLRLSLSQRGKQGFSRYQYQQIRMQLQQDPEALTVEQEDDFYAMMEAFKAIHLA